jgi:hypothetical protein
MVGSAFRGSQLRVEPTLAWRTRLSSHPNSKIRHPAVGEDAQYRPLPAGRLELLAKQ